MKIRLTAAAIFTAASLVFGPAAIASDATPPPGPKDLTWAQLAELKKSSSPTISMPTTPTTRALVPSCNIDMGVIHFRASGNIYDNGAVGIKPLLKCTTLMPYLSLSTTLYKKVWWGLQFETGPVVTTGSNVKQVQTKNLERQCLHRKSTTVFHAISSSSMVFPNGSPAGGYAFQENSLDCATF